MIPEGTLTDAFAADVVRDLQRTPKQLQSRYLYDALGSSLFDAICRLPWYRITRAEARLLRQHAPELATAVPGWLDDPTVVELGCGNGEKIEVVLTALPGRARRRSPDRHLAGRAAGDGRAAGGAVTSCR